VVLRNPDLDGYVENFLKVGKDLAKNIAGQEEALKLKLQVVQV